MITLIASDMAMEAMNMAFLAVVFKSVKLMLIAIQMLTLVSYLVMGGIV